MTDSKNMAEALALMTQERQGEQMTDFKNMTENEKLDAIYAEVKAQGAAQKEYHAAQRGFMKLAIGFMFFSGIVQLDTCRQASQTNATIQRWQQGLDMLQRDLDSRQQEEPGQSDSLRIEIAPYERPQDAPHRLENWPVEENLRGLKSLTI